VEPWTSWADGVDQDDRVLLADAQTSGGLLIACPPSVLDVLRRELLARGEAGAEIGSVRHGDAGTIDVSAGS
jgi:selenide, water dikinase